MEREDLERVPRESELNCHISCEDRILGRCCGLAKSLWSIMWTVLGLFLHINQKYIRNHGMLIAGLSLINRREGVADL